MFADSFLDSPVETIGVAGEHPDIKLGQGPAVDDEVILHRWKR